MSFDLPETPSIDRQLLYNSPVTLYFRQAKLDEHVTELQRLGYRADRFQCDEWRSEADLHNAFGTKLGFPNHYGRNLNALNDCLRDLTFPQNGGRALIFCRYDVFAQGQRDTAQALLEIIAKRSRSFLVDGRRLLALVQSNDPRIEFAPVGACPVIWNPSEWLNRNRGV